MLLELQLTFVLSNRENLFICGGLKCVSAQFPHKELRKRREIRADKMVLAAKG